ncbi:hypothetical protein [Alkalihalobacterium elongatum]|uniref:hypothetical protein n=1 Tax=Alkalihalobacterium elongatum TaxID=2675466 RepID=UPI001C1FFB18|nr:hypothetical protein [Alkalihalobacterium elongatum]
MISSLIGMFYTIAISFSIGGLMISKRMMPSRLQVFFVTLFFAFTVYLGIIVGRLVEKIIALQFIEILLGLVIIAFIVLAFISFHPTMGFFHQQSRILWSIIFLLFFLFGIEWNIREANIWLHFVSSVFFYFSILIGQLIQYEVLQKVWRFQYISFLPLVYLFFIAIFKIF